MENKKQNRYSESFRTRASDFDCKGRMKPSAVLDYFQEVAGAHAEMLGVGYEALLKNDILWVITKVKYQVVGKVEMHKGIRVHTWPQKPSRITFLRDYLIEDEDGNPAIIGTSEWVGMNCKTRKLAQMSDVYELDSFCEDKSFEEKLVKVKDFAEAQSEKTVIPEYCDLDINDHVNNIKYADYVMNSVDVENAEIERFQIDYHREVKKAMPVCIKTFREGNTVFAKGVSDEGEKMFSCSFILK